MGKETKIGMAVIGALLLVLGVVVVMRMRGPDEKPGPPPATAQNSTPSSSPGKLASGPNKPTVVSAKTGASPATAGTSAAASGSPWNRFSGRPADQQTSGGSSASAAASRYAGRYSTQPGTSGSAMANDGQGAYDPFQQSASAAAAGLAPPNELTSQQSQSASSVRLAQGPFPQPQSSQVAGGGVNPLRYSTTQGATATTTTGDINSPAQSGSRYGSTTGYGATGYGTAASPRYGSTTTTTSGTTVGNGYGATSASPSITQPAPAYDLYGRRMTPAPVEQTAPAATSNSSTSATTVGGPGSFQLTAQQRPAYSQDSSFGPTENGTYVVAPNDNYWSISEKMYGTGSYFKALFEHNRHRYPRADALMTGDVLDTPEASVLLEKYPESCPKVRTAQRSQGTGTLASSHGGMPYGGRVYVAKEGDTLFDIARHELGKASRWAEIYDLNRNQLGDDFDYLAPGTQLVLPGTAASQPATGAIQSPTGPAGINPTTQRPMYQYRR